MAATLYGCWFLILAGLNNGQFLCKSLNVDFFHAHISVNTREQMEQGIKPFLASRSGLYVWIPQEDDKQSFLVSFKNLFTGNVQYLAYRKIDKRVESPEHSLSEHAHGRIPFEYVDIVYYDSERSVWVFTSCSLDTYFLKEERNCIGPEVNSFETKSLDLIELSSSAAFHVKGNKRNNRFNTTMALPAIIQCNECGRQQDGSSIFSDIVTCGISGGVCSEPQEEFGFGRQCICPQGQYGALCDEYYGTSCKALEIIPLEGVNEFPLGAQTFYDFSYTLKENERGFGNTPVWVNEVEGYIDRVERREGLHWAITRQVSSEKDFYTIAIADAVSEMDAGAATSGLTSNQILSLLV